MKTTCTILGKGAPNELKDGRKACCVIAHNSEMGLFRFFPVNVQTECHIWDKAEIEIEKDGPGSREEDFKIECAEDWMNQSDSLKVIGKIRYPGEKFMLLKRLADLYESECAEKSVTQFANSERKSIAILRPRNLRGRIVKNEKFQALSQRRFWQESNYQDWVACQENFPCKAVLEFDDHTGRPHKQSIVAQEFYMGLKRFPEHPEMVFDIAKIYDPEYSKFLLLGNMKYIRTSFLVVHVHRMKYTQ